MNGFRDIIGQEMSIKHIGDAVRTGRAAHAYIIDGEKGMGKKMLSAAFAKALLCEKPAEEREDGEPCGVCHSCIMAESGNHPDLIYVTHEKQGSISVDEIRIQVVNDVLIKPYSSARKIYIIPDACLMTAEAQNALLKTLEEPPSYITIFLLADNREMLLPTIVSRAVCLSMRALKTEDIISYLQREKGHSPYETETAAYFARGNLGKAMLLAEDEDFGELFEEVMKVLSGVREMTDVMIYEAASAAAGFKEKKDEYLGILMLWFRDVLYLKSGGDREKVVFLNRLHETELSAERYSYEQLGCIIEAIKTAGSRMKSNVNPEYTYEMLFTAMR